MGDELIQGGLFNLFHLQKSIFMDPDVMILRFMQELAILDNRRDTWIIFVWIPMKKQLISNLGFANAQNQMIVSILLDISFILRADNELHRGGEITTYSFEKYHCIVRSVSLRATRVKGSLYPVK